MWVQFIILMSGLMVLQADIQCDTYPLCKLDLLHYDIEPTPSESFTRADYEEFESSAGKFDSVEENSFESPLFSKPTKSPTIFSEDVTLTEDPIQNAFRDFRLFDDVDKELVETMTTSVETDFPSTYTSNEDQRTTFKVNNAQILRDLAEFEGKQRGMDTEQKRPVPTLISTLVFPPLPRGDLYKVQSLDLDEGYFIFNFMDTFLAFIQPATYPLELARNALLRKTSLPDLFTQSLSYEPGTIAALTLGAMLGVGTPLALLGICCVAWTRHCSDDPKLEDPSDSSDGGSSRGSCGNCRRGGLVFAMFLLLVLLAAGVAGMFIANEQVGSATTRLPTTLDTALGDTSTFLRNSHQQLRFVVTSAIDQAMEATAADLDNIESLLGRPVQREIATETGIDVALDLLSDISMAAQVMAEKCAALHQNAGVTRQLARTTQERLAELRAQIDSFRRQCPGRDRPLCDTLDTKGLEVAVSLDRIIGDSKLAQLRRLRNDTLTNLAQQARTEFQFVPHQLEADTRDARIGLRRQLETRRNELYHAMAPLDVLARHLEHQVQRLRDSNSRLFENLPDLEQWRWLIGLCAGLSVLLIWFILLTAVTCGYCGAERQASCAIITSLVFLGLLSTALWLVALAGLVLGSRSELLVCRPLHEEPDFPALTALLDTAPSPFGSKPGLLANLAYSNGTLDVPLRTVLGQCRDNSPSYSAFQLSRVFDVERLSQHRTWSGYHAELLRMRVDLRQLQILSPELTRRLNALLDATSVDLAALRSQLSGHVTSRDLKSFASQLEGVAKQVRDQSTTSKLESLVTRTRRLLANNVQPLEKQKDELVYQMTALEVQMLPLQRQVNQSLSHLKTIQYFITNQGSTIAQEKSSQYAERLLYYVQQFQDYVTESMRNSVAPCRPLWNSFNAARQVSCDHLNDPLNGLWLCLVWSLIMLLAVIPTGLALREQYSRMNRAGLLARTTDVQDSPPSSDAWATPSNGDAAENW